MDGANKVRQFWSVTLPLLRPTIPPSPWSSARWMRCVCLTSSRLCWRKNEYLMASYAYYELINGQRMGYSSASSVIIFVIITIFAIGYIRLLGVDNS